MKVVVTGASGLLGRAVFSHLTALDDGSHQVSGLARSRSQPPLTQLDLLDSSALRSHLASFQPDVVIHCAAERRPDVVEKEPERSQELNVDVPARLAEMSREMGFRLIYISTDYVFDGSKPPYTVESEPNPLNAYGTSKLLGERMVREKGEEGRVTCLRVPVLYGPTLTPTESAVNVLTTVILPPADPNKMIKMDAYAVRYPTNVQDVARILGNVASLSLTKPLPPILHYQATEAMTKYDMCNVLSRLQNRHSPPLKETSVSHLDPEYEVDPVAATARPRHCKMDTSALQEYGVDVGHTEFEEWWSGEMERERGREEKRLEEAAREAEAARRKAEEEEKERQKKAEEAEKERRRLEEEERQRKAAEERQRAEEEAKEQQKREEEERQAQEAKQVTEEAAAAAAAASSATTATSPTSPTSPRKEDSSSRDAPEEAVAEGDESQSASRDPALSAPAREQSPHPSFSSLRARPTPPDVRSPSSSQPTSLRNAEGVVQPPVSLASQPLERVEQEHNEAPPTPPKPGRGPASAAMDQSVSESSSASTPQGSQTIRPNPFRQPHEMPAQLDTATQGGRAGPDEDEEIYGQASPHPSRAQRAVVEGEQQDGERGAFQKGYGEVKAGLDEATGKDDAATSSQSAGPAQPTFTIKVGDPHKVGDHLASTGHIVYTVRTTTNSLLYRSPQFSSLRRYNDFRWLHAALVHNNPGIIIPPVPEKVRGLISRFSPDLVEARRHGLETCVNKICAHPVLCKDEDLRLFLESEDFARDVKLRDARKGAVPTPEQRTWMGWSGTVGVNSGVKYTEGDEWFDAQRAYLDSLEAQLKHMVKGINALSSSRKELADSIAASSHALMMLSGSSLSRSLSAAFAGLGDLQRRAQELEEVQSDRDIRQFGSVLYEYERVVGSVRKAFSSRIDCWHLMVKSDEEFRKARVRHDRLKGSSSNPNGYDSSSSGGTGGSYHHFHQYEESVRDLGESETRALEARARFDLVGKRCKEEMARFDRERCKDVMRAVDEWLSGMLERREELLQEWEEYARRCLGIELGDPPPPKEGEEEKAADTAAAAAPATAANAAKQAETNGDEAQAKSTAKPTEQGQDSIAESTEETADTSKPPANVQTGATEASDDKKATQRVEDVSPPNQPDGADKKQGLVPSETVSDADAGDDKLLADTREKDEETKEQQTAGADGPDATKGEQAAAATPEGSGNAPEGSGNASEDQGTKQVEKEGHAPTSPA